MGGSFAARRAGNTPKKIPIIEEIPTAITTDKTLMEAGKKNRIIKTIIIASIRPKIPPNEDNITASDKN